jgi:methylated-DNA-[protein]-cysteine S-methyltransferase
MQSTLRHVPDMPFTWPDRRPRHLRRAVASPLGTLTLVADSDALVELILPVGATAAAGLLGVEGGVSRGARDDHEADWGAAAAAILAAAAAQLGEYFDGRRRRFDVPLRLEGTPFQRSVWTALPDIPYGGTVSYAELAERIGRPGAARATGRAVGQNPIAVIVPCHRVIGSDGGLTGYAGGLPAKRSLLRLEGARV